MLRKVLYSSVGVLALSERKLMNNFEFITPSVAPPARLNRNQYGWGVVFPLEKVYPRNYGKVLRQQKV